MKLIFKFLILVLAINFSILLIYITNSRSNTASRGVDIVGNDLHLDLVSVNSAKNDIKVIDNDEENSTLLAQFTNRDPFCDQNNYLKKTNPHTINLILDPGDSVCKDKDLLLIGFVTIRNDYFEKRAQIRDTWANYEIHKNFKVVFSLAKSSNETVNKLVKEEYEKYKDIILGDYVDNYYNLTTKIVMSFKWVSKNCNKVPFVLRINDDVVVNTPFLLKYLQNLYSADKNIKNTMMGHHTQIDGPHRDKNDKYYVSYEEFKPHLYDQFVFGNAYLITTDLAKMFYLLSERRNCPPFSTWIEDVYLGILAKNLGTKFIDLKPKYITTYKDIDVQEFDTSIVGKPNALEDLFFSIVYHEKHYVHFWDVFKKHANSKNIKI